MRLPIAICLIVLLSGCSIDSFIRQDDSVAVFTPEGQKHKVRVDARLLKKCPQFKEVLTTGTEQEIVDWAKKALANGHECRHAQHELVDWVIKTFDIEGD